MALDRSIQVALPEHGIAYKKVGGKTYVYYATAVYRNEKGQPTADRTSIGRLDEETGKLIPNRNYYEVYLKEPIPSQTGVRKYGVYYTVEEITKKLGLKKLLKQYSSSVERCFTETGRKNRKGKREDLAFLTIPHL